MLTQETDLLAPAVVQDPYPAFAVLRERQPVHWNSSWKGWVVADYRSAKTVLRDASSFSVRRLPVARETDPAVQRLIAAMGRWLSFREDAAHKELRRWLGSYVRHPEKGAIDAVVENCAAELAAEVAASRTPIDFAATFSSKLSNAVICKVLGTPREDWPMLARWAQELKPVVHSDPLDSERFVRAAATFGEILSYTTERTGHASREHESLFAALAARKDLDNFERAAMVTEWIFGGNETTASALSSAMTCLVKGPVSDDDLAGNDDLLSRVCEEVLRFEPPLKSTARVAVNSTAIGGVEIAEGDRILILIGAANRDPAMFEHPDIFDPGRPNNAANLTFGFGPHFCLGAHLARLELSHAVRQLATRGVFHRTMIHRVHWIRSIVSRSAEHLEVSVN